MTQSRGLAAMALVLVGLSVAGAVGALIAPAPEAPLAPSAREGGDLYHLGLLFGRVVPFIAGAAVALALWQRTHPPRPELEEGEWVRRHDVSDLLAHWGNAVGMVACLVTAVLLLRWFRADVSLASLYTLHFAGGAAVLFGVAHHVAYHLLGPGRGLLPARGDLKQAAAEVLGYFGVFARQRAVLGLGLPMGVRRAVQRPLQRWGIVPGEEDKYLATEKVISYPLWVVLLGVLVVTGVVKALRYLFPVPGPVLQASTWLHDTATALVVVMLVMHVAPVLLVPRNWPLLGSMFTGRIRRTYVQQHLARWYRRLTPSHPEREPEPARDG